MKRRTFRGLPLLSQIKTSRFRIEKRASSRSKQSSPLERKTIKVTGIIRTGKRMQSKNFQLWVWAGKNYKKSKKMAAATRADRSVTMSVKKCMIAATTGSLEKSIGEHQISTEAMAVTIEAKLKMVGSAEEDAVREVEVDRKKDNNFNVDLIRITRCNASRTSSHRAQQSALTVMLTWVSQDILRIACSKIWWEGLRTAIKWACKDRTISISSMANSNWQHRRCNFNSFNSRRLPTNTSWCRSSESLPPTVATRPCRRSSNRRSRMYRYLRKLYRWQHSNSRINSSNNSKCSKSNKLSNSRRIINSNLSGRCNSMGTWTRSKIRTGDSRRTRGEASISSTNLSISTSSTITHSKECNSRVCLSKTRIKTCNSNSHLWTQLLHL